MECSQPESNQVAIRKVPKFKGGQHRVVGQMGSKLASSISNTHYQLLTIVTNGKFVKMMKISAWYPFSQLTICSLLSISLLSIYHLHTVDCAGIEQVPGHEDVSRGAVLHEARQLRRGQCHESRRHSAASAPTSGTVHSVMLRFWSVPLINFGSVKDVK